MDNLGVNETAIYYQLLLSASDLPIRDKCFLIACWSNTDTGRKKTSKTTFTVNVANNFHIET